MGQNFLFSFEGYHNGCNIYQVIEIYKLAPMFETSSYWHRHQDINRQVDV